MLLNIESAQVLYVQEIKLPLKYLGTYEIKDLKEEIENQQII